MEESLKSYEKTIKKNHSFGWTPKYKAEFHTNLKNSVFIPIVEKTLQRLGWDLIYKEETTIEAKRKGGSMEMNRWTEAITIKFHFGNVEVTSESLGNEMWDIGRNSKRVNLFIYAFKDTEKLYDKDALTVLEKETKAIDNWDNYVIPENLPSPPNLKRPNFTIPLIGGLILSLMLGYILAKSSINGIYVIGLFELVIAMVITFSLRYLMKFSNYTNHHNLEYLLIGIIILTYFSNQYFQYEIITLENNDARIGFMAFIKLRLTHGLTFKSLNTGWIGLIISWGLQLGLTYVFSFIRLISNITEFQLERVPIEVVDFAFFHFIKGKGEDEVRQALAKKGWTENQNQNEVLEAIGAYQNATEINRIK